MAGAARDEAAHAVADDHEFLDRNRPLRDQAFEHFGGGAAIRRDVQA